MKAAELMAALEGCHDHRPVRIVLPLVLPVTFSLRWLADLALNEPATIPLQSPLWLVGGRYSGIAAPGLLSPDHRRKG